MEIIDDLEPTKRGVYGGVVGYLDFSGNLDTAIAIRTMTVSPDGRASVQAGAGHRGRQRPGVGERRVRPQGGRHALGGGHGPGGRGNHPVERGRLVTTAPDPTDPSGTTYGSDQVAEATGPSGRRPASSCFARDVVRASGPDVVTYLQGQCSQDVDGPGGRASTAESLLLSPQGKVEVYFRVTRTADDAFVLDTDDGFGRSSWPGSSGSGCAPRSSSSPSTGCASPSAGPGRPGRSSGRPSWSSR